MELENIKPPHNKMSDSFVTFWTYTKILILIAINIVVFLPVPFYLLWIIFGVELVLAILIKIKIGPIIPILKFLLINLIPLYLLFYFVDFDWLTALYYFGDYTSKIFVLLISLLLFTKATPIGILISSLSKIGFPKRLIFVIVVGINFIPLISAQLRKVVQFQKVRGYKVNLFKLKPILVPVIIYLLDISLNISLSLESRGLEI